MDEVKLGLGDGMLHVVWDVEGDEPGSVDLDIMDAIGQLLDWRKEWEGKPEIERGRALLAFVRSLDIPVTSVYAADQFRERLQEKYLALKKKTQPVNPNGSPDSSGSTASTSSPAESVPE